MYLPGGPCSMASPSLPRDPFHVPGPSRDQGSCRDDVTLMQGISVEPVAKTPRDRMALLKAAASGDPKFFLGSDSAPHSILAKQGGQDGKGKHAAGVWTQPFVLSYVLDALEQGYRQGLLDSGQLTQKLLAGFLGEHGRTFYREASSGRRVIVGPSGSAYVPEVVESNDHSVKIVPFRRGQYTRGLEWV